MQRIYVYLIGILVIGIFLNGCRKEIEVTTQDALSNHDISREETEDKEDKDVEVNDDSSTEFTGFDIYKYRFNRFTYNGITYESNDPEYRNELVPDHVILSDKPFIELKFTNADNGEVKTLQVIDNRKSKNENKSLNYLKSIDSHIYEETINHDLVEVIDLKVKEYEVSDSGIVFNRFGDDSYCSYYDFESKTVTNLQEEYSSIDVDISNNYIINASPYDIISYKIGQTITEIGRLDISDLLDLDSSYSESLYTIQIAESEGSNYYVVSFHEARKIFILDPNSLEVIKVLDGRWTYVHEDGKIYYSLGISLLSYDLSNEHTTILYNGGNPIIVDISKDEILCSVSIDAYPEFEMIDINANIMEEYKDYDYILFEQFWNIYSSGYLFDQVKSEFIALGEYGVGLEYKLKENSLIYRREVDQDVWSDMMEYELIEGYTLKIIEQ